MLKVCCLNDIISSDCVWQWLNEYSKIEGESGQLCLVPLWRVNLRKVWSFARTEAQVELYSILIQDIKDFSINPVKCIFLQNETTIASALCLLNYESMAVVCLSYALLRGSMLCCVLLTSNTTKPYIPIVICTIATIILICDSLLVKQITSNKLLTYSCTELLSLRSSPLCTIGPAVDLPKELWPRKRGILLNHPCPNLLYARCRLEQTFRDIFIIAVSETWLDESVLDDEVNLDSFTIIRSDRMSQSGKKKGGGVCL